MENAQVTASSPAAECDETTAEPTVMEETALAYGAELAYSAEDEEPELASYVPGISDRARAIASRVPRLLSRSAKLLAAAVAGAAAVAILWTPPGHDSPAVRIGPHTAPIPVAPPAASAAPPPPAAVVPQPGTKAPVRQPAAQAPASPPQQQAPAPKAEQLNKALNGAGLKGPGVPQRDADVAQEVCRRLANGSSPEQVVSDLADANPNFTPQQAGSAFEKSQEIYCP